MEIGNIVGRRCLQLHIPLGQSVKICVAENMGWRCIQGRRADQRYPFFAADNGGRFTAVDQALKLDGIRVPLPDPHRNGQGHGNQTGILAGKKSLDETGAGFRDKCNPIAFIEVQG
ncbi:hypothetical protein D3C80_998760 [compost metagenome]